MKLSPTLSSRHVLYVRDHLVDQGADPKAVFHSAELDLEAQLAHNTPLPVADFARLLRVGAAELNDDYFGMHVARGFHHESSGLMILTILSAPSVEAGLKTLVRYDKYIDPGIDTRLALNPDGCELSLTLLDPLNTERSQLNEYLITLLLQLLRTATRLDISPKEVRLQHAATRPKGALADFFDSPIHFNCERNALVFDNALLKETFVTSHQLLYSLLTKALQSYLSSTGEEHDFIDLVCREIIKQTEKETPNIETVANNLSMSVRTLRRHLSDEGYSFQDIKRVAKENQAKYFLTHTNMGQAEIAYELGYSEVSAFSRAFRSWTGETPQVYREKHTSE